MKIRQIVLRVLIVGWVLAWESSASASAQAEELEVELSRGQSGDTVRNLEAEAAAEPPTTGNRQELAVFSHRRGIPSSRLGRYSRAIDDLSTILVGANTIQDSTAEHVSSCCCATSIDQKECRLRDQNGPLVAGPSLNVTSIFTRASLITLA